MIRRLAFAALMLSLAWTTAPDLVRDMRRALDLRDMSSDERRAKVIGPLYTSVRKILDRTRQPLAIVTTTRADLDAALFFAYYAFPRVVRIYGTLDTFRMDRKRPKTTVHIDLARSPEARIVPYEDIRASVIGTNHIVYSPSAGDEQLTSFIVPLVSSGDGPAPDLYTTEAAIANDGNASARLDVTIYPSGHRATIELKPGERRTWTDFVWQTFGSMEVGWLDVRSDRPIRARFWFVNRGRRDADLLRFATWFRSASLNVPTRGRLWVLNPHDRELRVRLNEGEHTLPPRAVIPLEWVGGANASAEDDWYAFVTWRDEEGNTRFEWPEAR